MSPPPPAVFARRLARRQGGRWALRGVDLEVAAGRLVMICGANGAGKTTLIRLLATAITPSAGDLSLLGQPAGPEVRDRVGMVSHADHHYDELSALENLRIAARLGPARDTDPLEVLTRVGLAARAHDPVRGFSAGMRKRLAFARLLHKQPALVLLDEPYAGLDPEGHRFVDGLLHDWRARGTTVLVSTHQIARVGALCDDAVLLDAGRIAWTGPAADAGAVSA